MSNTRSIPRLLTAAATALAALATPAVAEVPRAAPRKLPALVTANPWFGKGGKKRAQWKSEVGRR